MLLQWVPRRRPNAVSGPSSEAGVGVHTRPAWAVHPRQTGLCPVARTGAQLPMLTSQAKTETGMSAIHSKGGGEKN